MHFSMQLSPLADLLSWPTRTTAHSISGRRMKIMIGEIDYLVVDISGLLRIWIGTVHLII